MREPILVIQICDEKSLKLPFLVQERKSFLAALTNINP